MEAVTIEKRWSEEKYRVMFHSQRHYNDIRIAMREKDYDKATQLIDEALVVQPTNGSMSNACQHMWGYFKKYATTEEKEYYMRLLFHKEFPLLLKFLRKLAEEYHVVYLIDSRILKAK